MKSSSYGTLEVGACLGPNHVVHLCSIVTDFQFQICPYSVFLNYPQTNVLVVMLNLNSHLRLASSQKQRSNNKQFSCKIMILLKKSFWVQQQCASIYCLLLFLCQFYLPANPYTHCMHILLSFSKFQ